MAHFQDQYDTNALISILFVVSGSFSGFSYY